MRRHAGLAPPLLLVLLLAGCGQKGPLYLPEGAAGNPAVGAPETSEDGT